MRYFKGDAVFKLIIVLYNETHPQRLQEYLECLQRNRAHSSIDTIHVIYDISKDTSDTPLLQCLFEQEIPITYIRGRPSYGFCFKVANNKYPGSKIILINGDIYFNETLKLLETYDLHNKFLALTRWNIASDKSLRIFKQYINNKFNQKLSEYSQDTWIFETPLRAFNSRINYILLGTMQCDSRIAYEAIAAGFTVLNPCLTIQCCHLHLSGIRHYNAKQLPAVPLIAPVPWIKL